VICRHDITVTVSLYPPAVAVDPPAEQPATPSRSWKRRQQKKRQKARAATTAVDVVEDPVMDETAVSMAFERALAGNNGALA
jgi:hypothetical protein